MKENLAGYLLFEPRHGHDSEQVRNDKFDSGIR